jgi:hypothetical protein
MIAIRLLFSALLPLATWLVLGAPDLAPRGTLVAFGVMAFFELNWLWQRAAFRLFRGDRYTYGHVNTILASAALLLALAIGVAVLVRHGFKIDSWRQLAPWALLGWLVCLVLAWLIPMLTTSAVEKLPSASDRRKYADPT